MDGGRLLMKIIKKRTIVLIIVCLVLGLYLGYRIFAAHKTPTQTWVVPNIQDTSKKFVTKETLVNEIHQKEELITMETQMSEKVTLDNSWGTLSLFKKIQNINYFGTGTYVVDLSALKPENIEIDNDRKEVTVKVSEPVIKGITINEEKTEYQTPENGLLRFGEIKLTAEENQMMLRNVKDKMIKKMGEQDFTSKASKASEDVLKNLVQTILQNKTNEKYNITIQYVK